MSVDKFMACKGQFILVEYTSTSTKPRAEFNGVALTKEVRVVCRAGIGFANLQSVKDGIKAGTRGEVGGLKKNQRWECYPYTIVNDTTGQCYYRLYPSSADNHRPTVRYLVDGSEVGREAWMAYLTPSARAEMESGKRPPCFDVKAENCHFPAKTSAEVEDDAEAAFETAVA